MKYHDVHDKDHVTLCDQCSAFWYRQEHKPISHPERANMLMWAIFGLFVLLIIAFTMGQAA